jgi:hypothetical protein
MLVVLVASKAATAKAELTTTRDPLIAWRCPLRANNT